MWPLAPEAGEVYVGIQAARSGPSLFCLRPRQHSRSGVHLLSPATADTCIPGGGGSPLAVTVRPGLGGELVALTGEIDFDTSPQFCRVIGRLLADGRHNIVVDLDAVTFLDGCAIAALIAAAHDVAQAGGKLLVTYNPLCVRLLKITGETGRLNIMVTTH